MLQARVHQCTASLRRIITLGLETRSRQQQVRGKKKTAKPTSNIKVRLLKGVTGYGRQGAVIAVAAGHMRNLWYPKGVAEYVTGRQLRDPSLRNVKGERDSNYRQGRVERPQKQEGSNENIGDRVVDTQLNLLSPQRSVEVLSTLLPPSLDFYRSPITAPAREPAIPYAPSSASNPGPGIDPNSISQPQITGIYGSVSTADVASRIRILLAENEEGSRVVLTRENISLGIDLSRDEDGERRLKQLGDYKIEINVRGASEGISRVVKVLPQE